ADNYPRRVRAVDRDILSDCQRGEVGDRLTGQRRCEVGGIEQGLAGGDYHPVFASGNWRTEEELAALDLLSGRRVDGLIVLPGVIPDDRLLRVAEELPLVVIGRSIAGIE